jgi:DNA-binding CsgD family transcriptional regulator/tetratricopeptide (TPR) repeat protein
LLLEAATRPPAVALVEGEAGVGKTRLVQELLARPELRTRQRCVGGARQLSEPFPLGPVVEALRDAAPAASALSPLAGALRPLLPELVTSLPAPPDPLGDRRAERHRLFRALREFLGALGPAVLVLEDLHWADETTVELLRFLAPQLPEELTVVCTYRRQDLPSGSPLPGIASGLLHDVQGVQVALHPLDRAHVRDLVATILVIGEVSDEFAGHLLESTGGLPFAVEEVLQLLADRRDLVQRRGVWIRSPLEEIGVPKALRDSIVERVERLGPEGQRLVEAAAVLGTPAVEELLLDVARVSDRQADRAFSEALSSALLVEAGEGRCGFRHALAQQAVEDAIPGPVRRRLHRRAARALEAERPRPVARLARHYREAGATREFVRHAEAASDQARSLEEDAAAFRFLKEALAVPGLPAATKGRLAVKFARHAQYCLAHGEAIDILPKLLDGGTLSRGTRGEIRLWLARLLTHMGEKEAAQLETERALEDLSARPALAAQAMSHLALPWATEGSVHEQLGWLDRALKTVARSTDRPARIAVAADRAAALLYAGDPAGWKALDEIPEPGRAEDEIRQAMRASANVAEALLFMGHYGQAEEQVHEGMKMRAQLAHSIEFFSHRLTELHLDWVVGRWDGLEERARFFMEAWKDWEAVRSDAQAVLGLALLARGEVQAALEHLDALAEDFRGAGPVLGWVAGARARIRLAQGRPEAAVEEGMRGLAVIRRRGVWVWATDVAPIIVEALLHAGRGSEAGDLARLFAAELRGRDAPAASAALAVCRALLAEAEPKLQRAARAHLAAERAWLALPRPYEAARARESAGRCLLGDGADDGSQLLVDAMDAFRALGATWDAARVRSTLREHGVTPPVRSGRKSYGDELSPRQAEVARLASRGMSNRQIAVALFLSPKTVEHHLSAAMHKLDVTSRTELAGRIDQLPPAVARQ